MHWVETKVYFHSADEQLAVELIADIFDTLGTKGVVVDDPHLDADQDWGPDAVPPPAEPAVTGFLAADGRLEQRRLDLEKALARLAAELGIAYRIRYRRLDEQDWAESWKAFFWPEQITPRLVVKPSWRDYTPKPGQQVIEIDPGMAFGTGTHPTTSLCIRLMEKHLRPGQTVLDVGTGSGILLIAAARLGAGQLAGVDLDPLAVAIARQNLLRNRIHRRDFNLHCGRLVQSVKGTYDLVVANILADVIIDLLDDLPRVLATGGCFICSGIIQTQRRKVRLKMARCGLRISHEAVEGDWVALTGRLPDDAKEFA